MAQKSQPTKKKTAAKKAKKVIALKPKEQKKKVYEATRDRGFHLFGIDTLVLADWNYKEDDEKLLKKLITNLKRNGLVETLAVRELQTGYLEVINGNHRLKALEAMEWKEPVMCFNFGVISDAQARRIAIELNETRFPTDNFKLAEILDEMKLEFDVDDLIQSLNFNVSDLDNFKGLMDFKWDEHPLQGKDGSDPVKTFNYNIAFITAEQKNAFVKHLKELEERLGTDELKTDGERLLADMGLLDGEETETGEEAETE